MRFSSIVKSGISNSLCGATALTSYNKAKGTSSPPE